MAWYWAATLLFGTALGLMMLGVPVAIGFFTTNLIAAVLFMGGGRGIQQVINNGFGAMTNFALVPIPMFLLMGELFYHTGLAARCFNAADKLLGNIRGRLAYVTLIGGTAYAGPAGSVDGRVRAARPPDGAGDDAPRLQQVPVDRPDHGRRRPRGDHPAFGAHRAARDARADRRRRAADRRRDSRASPRDDVRRADLGLDGDRSDRGAGVRRADRCRRAREAAADSSST